MSDPNHKNVNINNTPAENTRTLQEKMRAEKEYNSQLLQELSNDIKRKYDRFSAQHSQWKLHSAKLAEITHRYHDFETPVALRLVIVVTNAKNRLVHSKAEAENARRKFNKEKATFERSQKLHRQELRYLARGRLAPNPRNPPVDRGHDQILRETVISERLQLRPSFMSFGYFASALGITRAQS